MRRLMAPLAGLVLAALCACGALAADGRRVALVIGNSAYQHTPVLPNPRHDAQELAAAFGRLGFEVLQGIDLDKRSMEQLIRQFGIKLAGADVALFLYAGHGLQVAGQNYLLPVDARLANENDVDFEAIALNLVLKQMEREAKTSLVLLDACRDNPLARNLARSMGTRSGQIGQGLAEVKAGLGTLISFSTQPGNVAEDGAGTHSPYAAALLKHVETPGQDIGSTLIDVRTDVVKATAGRQVPWEHTSLMGRVVLSAPAQSAAPEPDYDKQMEIAFWNAVKDSASPELLQTYLDRFPQGTFAGLARVLMRQAEKEREVALRDDDLRRAESAKAAAERRSSETRLAAELKQAQEDVRRAREALAAAEKARASAVADAERTAQEQDSSRKSADLAARVPAPSSETDQSALVRSIQKELARVGCQPGQVDGLWGPGVTGAVERFNRLARTSLHSDAPTREALAAIASRKGRVCPLECRAGEKPEGDRCVAAAQPRKAPAATGGVSRSGSPPRTKERALQDCIQCCEQFGPGIGGGGCASLCWSRSPRIGSCFR